MSKKIFISSIIIFLIVFGFLIFNFRKTEKIKAGAADNVWGWAWSENIGWISFNCDNPELPAPRCTNDYGVNIDSSAGNFSDYAWSRGTTADVGGIGWIKFDPAPDFVTYPVNGYPDADFPYFTCLDLPGPGQACDGVGDWTVSGWARAYRAIVPGGQTLGGWEGWIKMRGRTTEAVPTEYGVWLAPTGVPDEYEFRGWAWGGDPGGNPEAVVGWISFNCNNPETGDVCGTSNYQVMASLAAPNQPPYIESGSATITGESYCLTSPTGQVSVQWIYRDGDGDEQDKYHLQVATDLGFGTLLIDCQVPQSGIPDGGTGTSAVNVVSSPSNVCNDGGLLDTRSLEIAYTGTEETRYWRVKVKDCQDPPSCTTGSWSVDWETGPSFTIPAHAYPRCDFSWSPQSPSIDELVQFTDQSIVYGFTTKVAWNWVFPADWVFETGYDASSQNPSGRFATSGGKTVSLTVTDSDGFACTDSKSVNVTLPLPEWKEIPPH